MSAVIIRTPPDRLAKLLRTPGGMTINDAVQAAQDNLQAIRESCIEGLQAAVQRMRVIAEDEALPTAERRREIYRISNEVFGTAGSLEMSDLSEAAYSLCEGIDRMATRWHAPTVEVHLATLSRLLSADGDPETCSEIIQGLRQIALRQGSFSQRSHDAG